MRILLFSFLLANFFWPQLPLAAESFPGNHVKIVGTKGKWELSVNDKIFRLKGAGVGRAKGRDGKVDYLKLAKEMGANTVRTWGIDQGSDEYLKLANQYGLYVDAGIWLNPAYEDGTCSYLKDETYKNKVKAEALAFIEKNKNNPAILFWNIGNETIYWTKNEDERVAFCEFLEELIQKAHAIDPFHPVLYSSSFTVDLPYLKKYVPSLDIVGINAYGGFSSIQKKVTQEFDIPYVMTEYGPPGPWDAPLDANGKPFEWADKFKAEFYKKYSMEIAGYYGHCLGGFVFVLGDTTQVSLSWWNLTYGAYKKPAYLAMQSFYSGQPIKENFPVIRNLTLSKNKDLESGEVFDIALDVGLKEKDLKTLKFTYFASTDISSDLEEYPNREVSLKIEGQGPKVRARAYWKPGIYRVYGAVVDDENHASVFSKTISIRKRK